MKKIILFVLAAIVFVGCDKSIGGTEWKLTETEDGKIATENKLYFYNDSTFMLTTIDNVSLAEYDRQSIDTIFGTYQYNYPKVTIFPKDEFVFIKNNIGIIKKRELAFSDEAIFIKQ